MKEKTALYFLIIVLAISLYASGKLMGSVDSRVSYNQITGLPIFTSDFSAGINNCVSIKKEGCGNSCMLLDSRVGIQNSGACFTISDYISRDGCCCDLDCSADKKCVQTEEIKICK